MNSELLSESELLKWLSDNKIAFKREQWKKNGTKIGAGTKDDVVNLLRLSDAYDGLLKKDIESALLPILEGAENGDYDEAKDTESVNDWVARYLSEQRLKASDVLMDNDKIIKMQTASLKEHRKDAKDHLITVLYNTSMQEKATILEGYKHISGGPLPRFISLITGADGPEYELEQRVMWHFFWQIKCKVFGLPVTNHIMPILYGKQDGGKTTLVFKMMGIFPKWFYGSFALSDIEDNRALPGVVSKYIQIFDEMQGADKAEIKVLKKHITAESVYYRPMGTNHMVTTINLGTGIALTNLQLTDLINDDTGMRRFYQINCADVLDWKGINGFDWRKVWDAIDPNKPSPISEVLSQVKAKQKVKHSVDVWFDSGISTEPTVVVKKLNGKAVLDDDRQPIKETRYQLQQLFNEYQTFAYRNQYKTPVSIRKFPEELELRGWTRCANVPNNKTYYVPPEVTI